MNPTFLLRLLVPAGLTALVILPWSPTASPRLAAQARAATPRAELLRLVPEDVGFCLVIQDLRSHWLALAESPFADQFQKSLLGRVVRSSPELAKLAEMEKQLKEHVGLDWPQLRDDILGDALVFAYRPGPPSKPDQDQGLFLVHARNAQALATLIERLNNAQKKAGDLIKLEEREHNSVKYYRRVERKQAPYFYWMRGNVLAISTQEDILRSILDLDKQAPAADKAPPLARQFGLLDADKGLLSLWLNPRAFDADLEAKAKAAPGPEALVLKTFLVNWKALEGAALTVAPTDHLEVSLAIRAKPDGLTPGVRKFLAAAAKPSELWNSFPDSALLAVAGRVDAPALLEMICDFLPEQARKDLRDAIEQGKMPPPLGKIAKDVFPSLGPDVGLCILAPPPQDKEWFPHIVWALRVRPGKDGMAVDQTLWDAINFFANLSVLDYNGKNPDRLSLKTVFQDKVEVKYFVNDKKFPAGFRPAFALKDGYLVFAGSPETVQRFSVAAKAPAAGAEVPLLRMNLEALRTYLKDRREPLLDHVAEKNQISKEEAIRRLESLRMGLQFLDRLDLTQRTGAGHMVLTLRVRTSQPLQK